MKGVATYSPILLSLKSYQSITGSHF